MSLHVIPTTVDKAANATSDATNAAIKQQTDSRVTQLAQAGREAIDHRLTELDREWDIERTLEANASAVALAGIGLGLTVDRRFFFLSGCSDGLSLPARASGLVSTSSGLPQNGRSYI